MSAYINGPIKITFIYKIKTAVKDVKDFSEEQSLMQLNIFARKATMIVILSCPGQGKDAKNAEYSSA